MQRTNMNGVESPNMTWVVGRSQMPMLPVYVKHFRHQHVKSPYFLWVVIRSLIPVLPVYVKHYRHHHVKSPHALNLCGNQITDAGVASLCQALQTLSCKVTELDLGYNQITDAGVVSQYVKHYRHQHVKSPNFIWMIIRSPMPVLPVYVKHYRHQHVKSPNFIWIIIR